MSSTICSIGLAVALRRLNRHAGGAPEVLEQRAVEAIEHGEVRLGWHQIGRLARAAAEHLLEQDAGLHRAQEHQELEVGDVDAGGQKVDGDDDLGVGRLRNLRIFSQRSVGSAGDLGDE